MLRRRRTSLQNSNKLRQSKKELYYNQIFSLFFKKSLKFIQKMCKENHDEIMSLIVVGLPLKTEFNDNKIKLNLSMKQVTKYFLKLSQKILQSYSVQMHYDDDFST